MSRRTLLVEGNDDVHVTSSLFVHFEVPKTFEVESKGGIDNLLISLPVHLKESDVEVVGLVVDANEDIEARWRSIKSVLQHSGYKSVPTKPTHNGTIIETDDMP